MISFSVTCERQKPSTEAAEMALKDSAGFSVEEMIIFEKCVLSSSGIKSSRASLALWINPRLRISFLPLSSASLMHLRTWARQALTTLFYLFCQVNELLKKETRAVPIVFPCCCVSFRCYRRRILAVNHGGVGFRWLTDLSGASLFIASCKLSVNVASPCSTFNSLAERKRVDQSPSSRVGHSSSGAIFRTFLLWSVIRYKGIINNYKIRSMNPVRT